MDWKCCISNQVPIHLRSRHSLLRRPLRLLLAPAMLTVLSSHAIAQQSASERPLQGNWLSYHGDDTGRRYSGLHEVTRDNITQLQLQWVFHSRKAKVLGATPVAVGGVIYLSASNDLFAIDDRTGTALWHHTRSETTGAKAAKSAHINHGVAILNHSVYMETEDGHLLSLDARSGNVLWDTPFAQDLATTHGMGVPLAIRDKVIVATIGNQSSFITAFDAATGKQIWKFEKHAASAPSDASHSSADPQGYGEENSVPPTYDPELNWIFADSGGSYCGSDAHTSTTEDQGTRCLIALDLSSGKVQWETPLRPLHPFSHVSSAIPVLVDAMYQGAFHKLIIEASGDKMLSILDRTTGKLLNQKSIDSKASYQPAKGSHHASTTANRAMHGEIQNPCSEERFETGWNPPSYSEQTHLFYFISLRDCAGGAAHPAAGHIRAAKAESQFIDSQLMADGDLLAYDPVHDQRVWNRDSVVSGHAPTGVMTTASGLVLYGGKAQSFEAADAVTGKVLWSFPMGQRATGSPMSYAIEGKQYFAIAAGNDLFVFGLP